MENVNNKIFTIPLDLKHCNNVTANTNMQMGLILFLPVVAHVDAIHLVSVHLVSVDYSHYRNS